MITANISGQKFARLTAIEPTEKRTANKIMWRCICDCGAETFANVSQLRVGARTSCGCAKQKGRQIKKKRPKHGHLVGCTTTTTYRIWTGMLTRVRNPNSQNWAHYGGKGVAVCERWLSFENFLADMGERPEGKSLDRIDTDGDYRPENCRWATDVEQHRNRSDNTMWGFKGESMPIAAWAERIGINRHTLADRVRKFGWTIEQALTTPVLTKQQIAAKANLKRWGYRPDSGTC